MTLQVLHVYGYSLQEGQLSGKICTCIKDWNSKNRLNDL